MTADDIFYVLEDSLHYPGIKSAIESLGKWEKKHLWGDLDEVLQKEYDRGAIDADEKYVEGYDDGCYEGAMQGKKNGYTLALQQVYDETDDRLVKDVAMDLAEKLDIELKLSENHEG